MPFPSGCICPITHQPMFDPVLLTGDGRTYEREAIEEWLKTHNTSPTTGETLKSKEIQPNRTVHEIIESFLQQNPALWEEVYWSKRLQRRIFNAVKAKDRGLVDRLLALDPRFIVNSWTDEEAGYRSCSLVALACQHGSAEILQLLLNRLGDLFQKIKEIQIETGRTELFFDAAYFIGVDGARLIGDKLGANEDTYRILIHSLIIAGEEEKYLKIVDVCLRLHPVLLEKMNEDGQMPIHTAAMHGRNKFIELLLEKGASAKVANAHGKRAVDLAREARHDETAQFIEQRRLAIKLRPFLQPLEAQLRTQQEAQTAAWKAWHHEKTTQLKHLSLEVQLGTPSAIDVIVSQLQQYPSVKRLTLLGVNNSLLKHSVGVAALRYRNSSRFFVVDFQGGFYSVIQGDRTYSASAAPFGTPSPYPVSAAPFGTPSPCSTAGSAAPETTYDVRKIWNSPRGIASIGLIDSGRVHIGTLDGCVFNGGLDGDYYGPTSFTVRDSYQLPTAASARAEAETNSQKLSVGERPVRLWGSVDTLYLDLSFRRLLQNYVLLRQDEGENFGLGINNLFFDQLGRIGVLLDCQLFIRAIIQNEQLTATLKISRDGTNLVFKSPSAEVSRQVDRLLKALAVPNPRLSPFVRMWAPAPAGSFFTPPRAASSATPATAPAPSPSTPAAAPSPSATTFPSAR